MNAGSLDAAWQGRVRLADADARPGRYYVTCRDDHGRTAFLLGPFNQPTYGQQGHARALGRLRAAKHHVIENYPRSAFWTFGTAWMPLIGSAPIGKLNAVLAP
jgi:hypothetical protein